MSVTELPMRRPPRFATRRSHYLRSRGPMIGAIARSMGWQLLPWQEYALSVGTELNPAGSHFAFRYQRVILVMPRQTGKTKLTHPLLVERALYLPGAEIWTTAQKGKNASDRWADLVADLMASPLAPAVSLNRGKGSERARFAPPSGSMIAPFAPTREGLHGAHPDLALIDEAWAYTRERGEELMNAVGPAQQTRRARQQWIISAMGDSTATWLSDLVDQGREAARDPESTTCYVEYSIPDDADPEDEAAWDFHPGLDGLITMDDLRDAHGRESHATWVRSYMNRYAPGGGGVIDAETWAALPDSRGMTPPATGVIYGYAVAIDRRTAAIYRAWRDGARTIVQVHRRGPDTEWLLPELLDLHSHGAALAADDGGPTRLITEALAAQGVPVKVLGGRDGVTAWTAWKSAVQDGQLAHDHGAALAEAIADCAEAIRGDGAVLSRRRSLGAVDPVEACYVAAYVSAGPTGAPIY